MLTLDEARECLRIDGTDNDAIIQAMLAAIPSYIEVTTGLPTGDPQAFEPLVDTVSRFLITLWYNAEQADSDKLQATIDSLLKALTIKGRKWQQ